MRDAAQHRFYRSHELLIRSKPHGNAREWIGFLQKSDGSSLDQRLPGRKRCNSIYPVVKWDSDHQFCRGEPWQHSCAGDHLDLMERNVWWARALRRNNYHHLKRNEKITLKSLQRTAGFTLGEMLVAVSGSSIVVAAAIASR